MTAEEGATNRLGYESDDEPADLTRDRWLQAQRDLVTTTLDYNLETLARLVDERAIDLDPSFQRRQRWDDVRQSRLIESFLMNVPMPPVFLNEDEYGAYSVIDGKQRLTAVHRFMSGQLRLRGMTVFDEANGLAFSELDTALQNVLRTRSSLRAIILLRLSDPLLKYHVFQRLNTGGIRLNAQEIRNAAFEGPLNQRLVELSSDPHLREMLGIPGSAPERSALWREMRDVELVLRYFALVEGIDSYGGSLSATLNSFMDRHRDLHSSELDYLSEDFLTTLRGAEITFGPQAFRRWNPARGTWGKQPLATLFEAQMLAVRGHDLAFLESAAPRIRDGMKDLFRNESFAKAIGASTNTPTYIQLRIHYVAALVSSVG